MKKITKAIIFEILPLFVLGNFFFVFLLLMEQMVSLAELLLVQSVPLSVILKTIVYYLPSFLVITIPISTLLAVLLAFSRFSADSELIAMQASGASGFNFIIPTFIFGVVVAALGIYLSTVLLPKGSMLAVGTLNKMLENLSISDIREKEMYTELNGMIFYVNKKIDNSNFEDIIMINTDQKAIISAKKGTIVPNSNRSLIMNFDGGEFTMTDYKDTYTKLTFGKMMVNLPMNIKIDLLPTNERLMGLGELRKNFSQGNIYRYEFAKRFSMPVSAIVMALLGLSLGVYLQRSGRSFGIALSCAVALIFNVLFIVGENFVNSYNPVLLAWMPLIVFIIILVPALRKVVRL